MMELQVTPLEYSTRNQREKRVIFSPHKSRRSSVTKCLTPILTVSWCWPAQLVLRHLGPKGASKTSKRVCGSLQISVC